MQQFAEFFHNHPLLFTALAVVLLALVANEIHGHLTGGRKLGALEAVRLINDRDPIILDVRPATEFKRSHLLNAQHVPLNKLSASAGQWSKDKPILVYCALGGSAAAAAEQLRKSGFAEVYPIRGGINAWLGANLPVTAK
jgi:rhodanese-related sulfurtransferase